MVRENVSDRCRVRRRTVLLPRTVLLVLCEVKHSLKDFLFSLRLPSLSHLQPIHLGNNPKPLPNRRYARLRFEWAPAAYFRSSFDEQGNTMPRCLLERNSNWCSSDSDAEFQSFFCKSVATLNVSLCFEVSTGTALGTATTMRTTMRTTMSISPISQSRVSISSLLLSFRCCRFSPEPQASVTTRMRCCRVRDASSSITAFSISQVTNSDALTNMHVSMILKFHEPSKLRLCKLLSASKFFRLLPCCNCCTCQL